MKSEINRCVSHHSQRCFLKASLPPSLPLLFVHVHEFVTLLCTTYSNYWSFNSNLKTRTKTFFLRNGLIINVKVWVKSRENLSFLLCLEVSSILNANESRKTAWQRATRDRAIYFPVSRTKPMFLYCCSLASIAASRLEKQNLSNMYNRSIYIRRRFETRAYIGETPSPSPPALTYVLQIL